MNILNLLKIPIFNNNENNIPLICRSCGFTIILYNIEPYSKLGIKKITFECFNCSEKFSYYDCFDNKDNLIISIVDLI